MGAVIENRYSQAQRESGQADQHSTPAKAEEGIAKRGAQSVVDETLSFPRSTNFNPKVTESASRIGRSNVVGINRAAELEKIEARVHGIERGQTTSQIDYAVASIDRQAVARGTQSETDKDQKSDKRNPQRNPQALASEMQQANEERIAAEIGMHGIPQKHPISLSQANADKIALGMPTAGAISTPQTQKQTHEKIQRAIARWTEEQSILKQSATQRQATAIEVGRES